MANDGYRLNVRVEIQRVNENGGYSADRFSVDENLQLDVDGFLGVAQVLGRFHELAEHIKTGGPENTENTEAAVAVDYTAHVEPAAPLCCRCFQRQGTHA